MPKYLILRKSGVHRAACFALYRALLRQKHQLQLSEHQQRLFGKPIRAVFKRNSKLQSPPQISTALQLGYDTLDGLHDGPRQQHVLNRIFELATSSKKSVKPEEPPSLPQTKITRAQKGPKRHVAPYPGATCTLARPFLELSGRRHVPVLVNANRVAFLRLKKPQPPFLSRIIRDTVETRERRIAEAARLASEIPFAEDEGDWDEILYKHVGLDYGDPKETPWECEVKRAFEKNHKLQVEAVKKRADVSAKMYAIMEQEKALAEEEKLRIRDEKHKVRKARRLARRGMIESEIQKKLYSQAEKTITPDAPAETEEVTKLGQEEVRQPNTKWRKRGDKYKTSDELKQLYEASLRPKTAEEVAKIKEARTRRKEEKAVLKDERRKRKQGNTAYWQRLNDEAKHSTNKPLGSDKEENLDKKAVPLKPAATLAVGRMDYGRMRLSPLVEDDPSTADKTEPPKFTILRPSYLKEKSKYP